MVAALNHEVTRLTGRKPMDAIKLKNVAQKPSSGMPLAYRPVRLEEQKLHFGWCSLSISQESWKLVTIEPLAL